MTFLKDQKAKVETLTVLAERATDLLQERRAALISAAVTGKIDVRRSPRQSHDPSQRDELPPVSHHHSTV